MKKEQKVKPKGAEGEARGNPRRGEEGSVLIVFALLLPVFLSFAALAVDVGHLYYVRTAMQATADAACFAGGSGLLDGQDEAADRATAIGNQNIAQTPVLENSALAVSFPSSLAIRTTVSNPAVPLFFGPVVGWQTAPVSATASCGAAPVNSVTGSGIIPLAVYCPVPSCRQLGPRDRMEDVRLGCGRRGNAPCGGEKFRKGEINLQAVYFDRSWSAKKIGLYIAGTEFYYGTVEKGDLLPSLSAQYGNFNGVLLTAIRARVNDIVVVPEVDYYSHQGAILYKLRVTGFLAVRITRVAFKKSEIFVSFEVVRKVVSSLDIAPYSPVDGSSALATKLIS